MILLLHFALILLRYYRALFQKIDYQQFSDLVVCEVSTNRPVGRAVGNAFVSGAEGQRFKSQGGQIGHSVASGSPLLQYLSDLSCVAWAQ